MPKRRPRVFSRAFKLAAVRRMLAGEDISALSRELQVLRKDLYYWREHFRSGGPQALRGRLSATSIALSYSKRYWMISLGAFARLSRPSLGFLESSCRCATAYGFVSHGLAGIEISPCVVSRLECAQQLRQCSVAALFVWSNDFEARTG
jgi:Transposase